MTEQPTNRWLATDASRGDVYDERYEQRAAAGENVHGEADFVERTGARSVLDAGCGTGRVARELARRGLDVTGVDLDPAMLVTGQSKAPTLDWRLGDLATIDLGRTYDAVLLAGNVMIFLTPGSEDVVLANLARHLNPGGVVIAGFQTGADRLSLTEYDAHARAAGLELTERYATWDREQWRPGGAYAVTVHRHP